MFFSLNNVANSDQRIRRSGFPKVARPSFGLAKKRIDDKPTRLAGVGRKIPNNSLPTRRATTTLAAGGGRKYHAARIEAARTGVKRVSAVLCCEGQNAHMNDEPANPPRQQLKFRWLKGPYAIVRLAPDAAVPDWAMQGDLTSITRTAEELSIVCPADNLPPDIHSSHRWICLKLEGPFPFSLTGVLLSFIEPLSSNRIPIFAISTYDTDYVLIQEEFAGVTLDTLQRAGHELLRE
jgi:uncharacterized protein